MEPITPRAAGARGPAEAGQLPSGTTIRSASATPATQDREQERSRSTQLETAKSSWSEKRTALGTKRLRAREGNGEAVRRRVQLHEVNVESSEEYHVK